MECYCCERRDVLPMNRDCRKPGCCRNGLLCPGHCACKPGRWHGPVRGRRATTASAPGSPAQATSREADRGTAMKSADFGDQEDGSDAAGMGQQEAVRLAK